MLPEISENSETKVIRGNSVAIEMEGKDRARAYQQQLGGAWKLESGVVQESMRQDKD